MKENMVQKNQEERENIMNELDINQSLGIEPVGNKNGKELNDFKDTLETANDEISQEASDENE